jgi:hypothetical protein
VQVKSKKREGERKKDRRDKEDRDETRSRSLQGPPSNGRNACVTDKVASCFIRSRWLRTEARPAKGDAGTSEIQARLA